MKWNSEVRQPGDHSGKKTLQTVTSNNPSSPQGLGPSSHQKSLLAHTVPGELSPLKSPISPFSTLPYHHTQFILKMATKYKKLWGSEYYFSAEMPNWCQLFVGVCVCVYLSVNRMLALHVSTINICPIAYNSRGKKAPAASTATPGPASVFGHCYNRPEIQT